MATLGKRAREGDYQLTTRLRLLPAAQFLWFNDVPIKKRLKFEKILVKLMKLFVTPHVTNLYPYLECSYLKKYEILQKTVPHCFDDTINFLGLENKSIEHFRGEFQVFEALLNDTYRFEKKFVKAVKSWYENTASKPMLFISINLISDTGHAVFIVFKKYVEQVKFFYFDPHGYDETSLKTNILIRLLSTQLTTLLTIPVREVVSTCPTLQLSGHGGNCLQWFLLIFALLIINEDWFDNPILFLNKVAEHGTLNIMLFSLACFLRFIHFFGLQQYYFVLLQKESFEVKLKECNQEDKAYRQLLASELGVPNCNDLEVNFCPTPCRYCDNRCRYKVAVQTTEGKPCKLLNPKEIAYKMFRLYFKLQKLASHERDTFSFNQSHMSFIEVQLELPETLEDLRHVVLSEKQYQELKVRLEVQAEKSRILKEINEKIEELDLKTIQTIFETYEIIFKVEFKNDKPLFDHVMLLLSEIFDFQNKLNNELEGTDFIDKKDMLLRKIEYTLSLIPSMMEPLMSRERRILNDYSKRIQRLQGATNFNEGDWYLLNSLSQRLESKKNQKYVGLNTNNYSFRSQMEELESKFSEAGTDKSTILSSFSARIHSLQEAAKTEIDRFEVSALDKRLEDLQTKRGNLFTLYSKLLDRHLNELEQSLLGDV